MKKNKKVLILIIVGFVIIVFGLVYIFLGDKIFSGIISGNKGEFFDVVHKTNKGNEFQIILNNKELEKELEKKAKNILRERYLKVCEKEKGPLLNYNLDYCNDAKNDTLSLSTYFSAIQIDTSLLWKYDRPTMVNGYGYPYSVEYAKLNDKIILIYENNRNKDYGVYAGIDINSELKWPYEYYFLVNFNTNEVIEYNEEIKLIDEDRYKYAASNGINASYLAKRNKGQSEYNVYTMDSKYIGKVLSTTYSMVDNGGNIYTVDDNIISKYNTKGDNLKTYPKIGDIVDFTVYKNACFVLAFDDKDVLYLYNLDDNSKIKIDIVNIYGDKGYIMDKEVSKYIIFQYSSDTYENEININLAARNKSAGGLYQHQIAYEYSTKTIKQMPNSNVYKNKDISIELKENIYSSDNNETTTMYELYINNKIIEVESKKNSYYSDILCVYNKKNIYILNTKTKEIITYYTSNKMIDFDERYEWVDNSQSEWFFIYDGEQYNDGKLVVVANSNGEIVRANKESILASTLIDNELYLAYDKKIVKYSYSGEVLKTITYDKIFIKDDYSLFGPCVKRGNNYYVIDLSEKEKESLLKKESSYSNDKMKVDVYKADDKEYLFINDTFESVYEDDNEEQDDNYGTYSYGDGMCGYTMLVDKKNNEIIKYDGLYGFIKTKSGYFFTSSVCSTDGGPITVFTTEWKEIGLDFLNDMESENGGYVYVDNHIIEVDIDGQELRRSKEYSNIDSGINKNNTLYVEIDDNKKTFLVTIDNNLNEISRLEICSKEKYSYIDINEDGDILIYVESDKENDGAAYENYKYDENKKELIKVD